MDNRLSITALLDWFTPRTTVSKALQWVDEFVPQFYDAGPVRTSAGVAEPIDAQQWAPIFNAYQIPYRIGVASFGRIARRRTNSSGRSEVRFFRDASPLDFAGRRQFRSSTSMTTAGEIVVHYDVAAPLTDNPELIPGDAVDITFPTDASVDAANEAVGRFGGYCAGVIFFRWPNRNETLTLLPDDVMQIISGKPAPREPAIEVRTPSCMERRCSDVYLDLGPTVHPNDRTMSIRASDVLELFIPAGPSSPVAMRTRRIVVQVPAYSGLGKLYVGRAISSAPVQFEVISE